MTFRHAPIDPGDYCGCIKLGRLNMDARTRAQQILKVTENDKVPGYYWGYQTPKGMVIVVPATPVNVWPGEPANVLPWRFQCLPDKEKAYAYLFMGYPYYDFVKNPVPAPMFIRLVPHAWLHGNWVFWDGKQFSESHHEVDVDPNNVPPILNPFNV
jgi:hypothetical protein